MKKYILVCQVTRSLVIDIVNAMVRKGAHVILFSSVLEEGSVKLHESVEVNLFGSYSHVSRSMKLYYWTTFTIRSFFKVLCRSKDHELVIISTPPFSQFIGLLMSKIRKQRFHLIIWDLYPDVFVNLRWLSNRSLIYRIWSRLNTSSFYYSSSLITIAESMSKAICRYTIREPNIIYNWVSDENIAPVSRPSNKFVLKHNLVNDFVVMYSGNMGLTHNMELIVACAERLNAESGIKFVLIGNGMKRQWIEQQKTSRNLSNMLVLDFQDQSIFPHAIAAADINIVTLSPGAESVSVPSKTYSILAAGSCVLALSSKESELSSLIERHQCGRNFEGDDLDNVSAFILELKGNARLCGQFKKNASMAAKCYTKENAVRYADLLMDYSL